MGQPGSQVLVVALALSLPLAAQQIQLQGPTSGLIYDSASRSIRPILGLAGGAHLGSAIVSDLDYASIAPNGRSALVVESGQVALIRDVLDTQAAAEPLH